MYVKSLLYNRKNSGLSIEPYGTPCLILSQSELFFDYSFFNVTLWYLSFNRILSDHLLYHSYHNTPVLQVIYHIAYSQTLLLRSQNSPPTDSLLSGAFTIRSC